MTSDVIKTKSKKLPSKFRIWWKKRSDGRLIKANNKREQSIGILQKRYGYTKEKATSELDEHYPKARLC
jgi:uncharacterized protein YjbJ (UPF0337 family)